MVRTGAGAKRRAHEQAREGDLRDHFSRGETIEVFIEKPPEANGGEEALGRVYRDSVNDARVFIEPGQYTLNRADRVRCRIRNVKQNTIKALAVWKLD